MRKRLIRRRAKRLAMMALPYMLTLDSWAEGKGDPMIEEWAVRRTIEQEESAYAFIELMELVERHSWLKEDVKDWR